MKDLLLFDAPWWHVVGWTMIHFLWLGAVLGVIAAAGRFVIRRAAPQVRYAAALGSLMLLTALPLGIAAWLVAHGPATQVAAIDEGSAVVQAGDTGPLASAATPNTRPVGPELTPSDVTPAIPPTDGEPIIELSNRDPAQWGQPFVEGATGSASASAMSSTGPVEMVAPPESTGGASGTRALGVLAACVPYLPWLWIVGTPLTFVLLATGVIGAERLRRASRTIADGPIVDACARLAVLLRIGRRVTVAICERIAAPVLVGIVRPIILLPPAALMGWSPDEVEMVLLHELAHVRRWDNLVNLLQRLIESLLFFHPAVWLASSWVRREREACCDAVVVQHTQEPQAYAEMLVAFAASRVVRDPGSGHGRGRGRPGSLAAASAMAAGPLRSRIRQLLKMEDDPMLVSTKSLLFAALVLLVAATLAVLYLPAIGQAEESTTEATESGKLKDGQEKAESEKPATVDWTLDKQLPTVSPPVRKYATRVYKILAEKVPIEKRDEFERQIRRFDPARNATFRWTGEAVAVWGPPEMHAHLEELFERKSERDFPFPSLEEQKLADLAWKVLGLELEPIGEEDLNRVKALGYDGGVKVTVAADDGGPMKTGDLLVGLHVWPTKTMQDVIAVLRRRDLAELNPLKFYAVRRVFSMGAPSEDFVARGRTSIDVKTARAAAPPTSATSLEAPRLFDPTDRAATPATAEPEPRTIDAPEPQVEDRPRSVLRYEGKRFDEWRDAWRTELSAEKRLEAVKALAAFGANGYGKEAAEAILEVVKLYDWTPVDDSPVGRLKSEAIDAFAGKSDGSPSIPWRDWSPGLIKDVRSGDARTTAFAKFVFERATRVSPATYSDVVPQLLELSRDEAFALPRFSIFYILTRIHQTEPDDRIVDRMSEALSDNEYQVFQLAARFLYPIDYVYPASSLGIGRETSSFGGRGGRRGRGGRGRGPTRPELPPDAEYRPQIIDALKSTDPQIRATALTILSALGPKARPHCRTYCLRFSMTLISNDNRSLFGWGMQSARLLAPSLRMCCSRIWMR